MREFRRRALLASGVASFVGLSGCSLFEPGNRGRPDGGSGDSGELPDDLRATEDGVVVAYESTTDGDPTVSEGAITFADPPVRFVHESVVDGGRNPEGVRSAPRMRPFGTPTVYVAPVFREGLGFRYQVYANRPFVERAEWHVFAASDVEEHDRLARFTPHGPIYRDIVTDQLVSSRPDEPITVGLATHPPADASPAERCDLTAVVLSAVQTDEEPYDLPTAPPREFAFEFDAEERSVTVTYEGVCPLNGAVLSVTVAGGSRDAFEGTVETDDAVTVDLTGAEPGDRVAVVDTREEETLGAATVPESFG